MEQTFGKRLQMARKVAGIRTQQDLGDLVGVTGKTIRNYETDVTHPDSAMLEKLRRHLGNFDEQGDAVEVAVRQSPLAVFRQTKVIGYYQEQLHEQEREGRRGA